MCGSKGSAPTPSSASTTTAGSSTGSAITNFAQGPTPATGQRYEDFLNKVTSLAQTPFDPSTLSSVAPLNDFQNQGLAQMFNLGMTMGDFQPEKIQEIMSPYIQNVVQTSQDWFNNQNKIQGSNLISQGIRSGNAFGGDRAGIAEAELAGQQQLAQAPVIAGLYQSGYGQALNEYNTLKQFGIQGAEEAVKAGTVQQAQAQRELDIATQNALQQSGYPFQVANWEGAALGGIGPLTGTVGQSTTSSSANTTGISNPPTPNPLTQALGVGSSLIGLGTAVTGSGGSIFGDTTAAGGGGGVRTAKHGGRIRPRKFAYGGDTSNFDDETNYAGYGSEPSRDSFDERFSGETGGGSSRDDSSSVSRQSDDDKKDDGDILDKFMKVGEKPPQIKPPASVTGAFPKIKNAASRNPYISPTLRGYGATANIPQSGTPQSGGGSSTGSTIGKTIGGIGGTLIGGPVGGMIGSAAGSLFGGMFGKDGGRVGRYYEEGDTIEEVRAPVTGNPEDEAAFKRNMTTPLPRMKEVSEYTPRPSIPTPDPLAPYLGTEGPRSVTGPPRGSPAGNEFRAGNPVQARDASPLQLTRERLQRELEDNPRLARTFDANTTAEVGRGGGSRQGYQAATLDRAVQTGQPLRNIVNNPAYYPWSTRAATATTGQGVDESLWAGANPVNYATGNASRDPKTGRDVGFAGGPQTASIGRERYGIEGQSALPYARAVGYTGPDRTPIGFVAGAPVGSQGTPLAGAPANAAGDLEVSAQSRRPQPGRDPNAPNFGYGPVTTQQVPGLGPPPRDAGQRWAVNPFTQAGIAMLRSQSPYFATGLGEGLAGAAGAIEHTREQQVLDSRPKLLTDFPTFMWQKGDGTFVDTHVPNPGYDAKKLPRDKFEYEQKIAKGQKWKPTGMIENGRIILYNEQTGQTKLGERVDDQGKPVPATAAPAATSTQPEKTTAAWAPNLNADPADPAVKELVPDEGPISKKTVEDRAKANIKTLDKAREQHEAANQQIGRMNQMETALSALPKEGFMSPGYLAGYNATIASAINHAARMVGAGDQFSPEQVAAMEEANKIKTLGGFLQSRLTGGGQHNAAAIIQASMRAYPGAENSPQGAALIIAANREVAQRDRDYYEFITKHGNTTFRGNLNAATLYFDRVAPMEKYIERARAKVEVRFPPTGGGAATTTQQPKIDAARQRALDWLQKNPNDPDAPAVRQRLGI